MHRLFAFLIVLLCAAETTLSQESDCSTEAGRSAFLRNGAATYPECYIPVMNLTELNQIPTASQIKLICQENCASAMLDFFGKCSDNEIARETAYFLENVLCAYRDGDEKPETSCLLVNLTNGIEGPFTSCFGWWYNGETICPAQFPDTTAGTPLCTDALKTAVEGFGCCLHNLFGTEKYINQVTEISKQRLPTVPEDFRLDITDPKLYAACGVTSFPADECKSLVAPSSVPSSTPSPSSSPTPNSTPALVATPLVALLLAILATLATN